MSDTPSLDQLDALARGAEEAGIATVGISTAGLLALLARVRADSVIADGMREWFDSHVWPGDLERRLTPWMPLAVNDALCADYDRRHPINSRAIDSSLIVPAPPSPESGA